MKDDVSRALRVPSQDRRGRRLERPLGGRLGVESEALANAAEVVIGAGQGRRALDGRIRVGREGRHIIEPNFEGRSEGGGASQG